MAERTYISPLSGWRIVEDNGKTYISPLTGWAVQDAAAAGGATSPWYYYAQQAMTWLMIGIFNV